MRVIQKKGEIENLTQPRAIKMVLMINFVSYETFLEASHVLMNLANRPFTESVKKTSSNDVFLLH
jgi:hypothetical protein